jgi:hypothetical protein
MRTLVFPAVAAGVLNGAAAFSVDNNLMVAVGVLLTTVTLTLSVTTWIDKRIDHKLKNSVAMINMRFYMTMQEISNLRQLMGHPPLDMDKWANEIEVKKKEVG